MVAVTDEMACVTVLGGPFPRTEGRYKAHDARYIKPADEAVVRDRFTCQSGERP